jgi:hypothetical protein
VTNDYYGPCMILLDRSTTVEVRRGGRVEFVSMPRVEPPHDGPSGRHVEDSTSRKQR